MSAKRFDHHTFLCTVCYCVCITLFSHEFCEKKAFMIGTFLHSCMCTASLLKNCSESIVHSRNRFVCKVQLVTISPLVSNGFTSGLPAVAVLAVSSKCYSESFLARIGLYARLFGQLITITPPPPPPPCSCRAGSVLSLCANITCLLSVMMQPYMPQVSQQIQEQTQVGEKWLWYIHI